MLSLGWIQLRLVVRCEPGHEKGDCLKVPERSYHSATLPGRWKLEEGDQKSSWMHVQPQISLVERGVMGSIPQEGVRLLPSITLGPILSLLCPIIVMVAELL